MRLSKLYVVLLCCVLGVLSAAQDRVASAIDSLSSHKSINQVIISPDGSQVAYIVGGEPFVVQVTDGMSHRIAADQNTIREVTWSADSRRIAWLCDPAGGQTGLLRLGRGTFFNTARPRPNLGFADPKWLLQRGLQAFEKH